MLKDVRPAAVVVAAPLALHFEMCLAALDSGAAVFCEKLMCYSLDQARRLTAEVERRGAVFQVGLQRRANAVYRQAVAMVETGMLGEIVAIKCQWHRNNDWRRPIPVPRGDARWAGLERQLNWRLYRDTSQGLMAELASHQIDVANEVLAGHPTRVLASGGIDHWRDGREVFDNLFCVYEYVVPRRGAAGRVQTSIAPPGGVVQTPNAPSAGADPGSYTVRVSYSSIQNNAFEGASELILGTRGTLFLTTKKGLFYTEEQTDARPASAAGPTSPAAAEQEAALVTSGKTLKMSNDPWAFRGKPFEIDVESDDTRDELVSFVHAAARGDRQTACPASAGLVNAATILMANEALYSGGVAAWPTDLA
jgi:predicted dehydrogenase